MIGHKDFDYRSLEAAAHRPWPLPGRPWIMTQSWHDLLFAHWPVDQDVLRAKVPSRFPIDLYDTQAWLGIIPFHMTNVAPRGVPALPWISAFPELNVRTYVTVDGKPGVYFFSLDARNPLAVGAARALFHLPYFSAGMTVSKSADWIDYRCQRIGASTPPAVFTGKYRPAGTTREPAPGSLEYFLTERYCLYTTDRGQRPHRVEIHHAPWPLQPAELQVSANTMAEAAGIRLPSGSPLLHFARRQDVVVYPPEVLSSES